MRTAAIFCLGVFSAAVMLSGLAASGVDAATVTRLSVRAPGDEAIPPEVLRACDPAVLSGQRPTVVTLDLKDLLGLRENAVPAADFVRFAFDPDQVSSVQASILRHWVAAGGNSVLLVGTDLNKYGRMLGLRTERYEAAPASPWAAAPLRLSTLVPTSADVATVSVAAEAAGPGAYPGECSAYWYAVDIGRTPKVTPVAYYGGNLAAAGVCEVGTGKVYFMPGGVLARGDAARWRLNFFHWALGLEVPKPASTAVAPRRPEEPRTAPRLDGVLMANGDVVVGTLISRSLMIKTPYALLELPIDAVDRIAFGRGADGLDAVSLAAGGRYSGVVQNAEITIRLPTGREVALPRGQVRAVVRRPVAPDGAGGLGAMAI